MSTPYTPSKELLKNKEMRAAITTEPQPVEIKLVPDLDIKKKARGAK